MKERALVTSLFPLNVSNLMSLSPALNVLCFLGDFPLDEEEEEVEECRLLQSARIHPHRMKRFHLFVEDGSSPIPVERPSQNQEGGIVQKIEL